MDIKTEQVTSLSLQTSSICSNEYLAWGCQQHQNARSQGMNKNIQQLYQGSLWLPLLDFLTDLTHCGPQLAAGKSGSTCKQSSDTTTFKDLLLTCFALPVWACETLCCWDRDSAVTGTANMPALQPTQHDSNTQQTPSFLQPSVVKTCRCRVPFCNMYQHVMYWMRKLRDT